MYLKGDKENMEKRDEVNPHRRVQLYDGYRGTPIWKQPENNSVYYNKMVDKQCRVPIGGRDEILKELNIK